MPLSIRNVIHSWLNTFPGTDYCLPNRTKEDNDKMEEDDVSSEAIQTEGFINVSFLLYRYYKGKGKEYMYLRVSTILFGIIQERVVIGR